MRAPSLAVTALLVAQGLCAPATAQEIDGRVSFNVRCGRCHSAVRVAAELKRRMDGAEDPLAVPARFGHFMKDDATGRAIIRYLRDLAARDS